MQENLVIPAPPDKTESTKKYGERTRQLIEMGFVYSFREYRLYKESVRFSDITNKTDEEWNEFIAGIKERIGRNK